MPVILFMVGYMGSGKTTIGRKLAKALNFEFIDLDSLIELRTGRSISTLFRESGEEEFRKQEQHALKSLAGKSKIVVATGGGCAAYADNMDWMNANGITIFLRCHPGTLFHRIAPTKARRPMIAQLEDVDLMEFITESLKNRLPYYLKSHITVTGEQKNEDIVTQLRAILLLQLTSSSGDLPPTIETF